MNSVIRWWKPLSKDPTCVFALLILGNIAWDAGSKYIFSGEPIKDIVLWLWTAISTIMDKPLIQLLMVPLAIWLFVRGTIRVGNANEEALKRQTQTCQKLMHPVEVLFDFFGDLKKSLTVAAEVQAFSININELEKGLCHLKTLQDQPVRDDWDAGFEAFARSINQTADNACRAVTGNGSALHIEKPNFDTESAKGDVGGMQARRFSAAKNDTFFDKWNENLTRLRELEARLAKEAIEKQAELSKRNLPDFGTLP